MIPLINSLAVRAADAPAIKPSVALGTPLLLTIAVAGVALLLLMIIRFKIQAFVALLAVSILVAVAAQIPLADVFTVVANGVGGTMGKVALLIALGAVLGRMIEVSGGVQSLANHFTEKLGAKRVAVALTAVGFLVAIPVFFEVGIIVLVPIVYAFAKIAKLHPIKFGLPMAGIMLSIHVAVPPHPGIVAGAGVMGADIGLIAMISLIICVPLGFLSYWVASIMNRKDYELLPGVRDQIEEFGSDSLVRVGHDGPGASAVAPPRPGLIMFLIAAPIVQILLGTAGTLLINKKDYWYGVASFVGNPFFALLVAVALAFFLLAVRRQWSLKETGEIFEGALPPIASILMVVAAGGVFGGVLQVSGIGAALSQTLDSLGVPIILLGFIISLALRAAQGSATVAIVTTTGLLSAAVAQGGYTPAQIAVIVIAIGFGGLGLSHVTDAGFWVVVRYYGLTVSDGLKTWTVLTTILGVAGFLLSYVAWILVGGLAH
ncbi:MULTISPECIES: GntP family transporter [Arthrobacter]|jgi:GntP family gluconate:H+ symporter|uniref:GntP family gluconate:H+ symporter n=1 Tax=Arthrobacter bambusae TaxID=1338426 RepID=A0AAW8DMI1_9MICC|nr:MULTISPECIES: GntP family transporter [Arthrobacter]MDP9907543.1 GntP family gluconate:H+ symporter [Arthrobacter bambusae]MDQ0131748.1 GntP family gluconate:H+ symporter [Arthrobacter bambusae]MDQ0183160.1 GntP family gluconate:H+ symporter [Arthrobacter bambusae]MDQ0240424.1 GntP family gluconate:H+ symporter [Arthrobacter bambusae]GAP58860.1 inner membrane permease YgbN [Arthrobacter sp. Hiyo1]